MRDKSAQGPFDRQLARLVATQGGIVTRAQLLALGLGPGGIGHRVARGKLHGIHRGVYAVGHAVVTPNGRWLAAVLACGPGAALSHRDGGALWAMRRSSSTLVDVTVPTRSGRRRRDGIRIHRSPLDPADVTQAGGIPVTTPSRTLLDLAEVLPGRAVERALDETERLRLFDLRELEAALKRNSGRAGAHALRAILDRHLAGTTLTRSVLEETFLRLCRARSLPPPQVNARAAGFEVDFLWRAQRLIVEVDGYAAHGTRAAFERDRARDVELRLAGFTVLRFTYCQVTERPAWVAAQVRRALSAP